MAWLFTIARNVRHTAGRHRRRVSRLVAGGMDAARPAGRFPRTPRTGAPFVLIGEPH